MIIVKLMGGLGNQMFQYAFGKYLAIKNNTPLKLDTTFLLDRTPKRKEFVFRDFDLDIFKINDEIATEEEVIKFSTRHSNRLIDKALTKLLKTKKSHVKDVKLEFNSKHLNIKNDTLIEGYWQSEKYFDEISDLLRNKYFVFKNPLLEKSELLKTEISNSNSLCVNIRRGDFVINSFHGTIGPDYYKKAEKIILKNQKDIKIYVFSDDIEWCKTNLEFESPTTFVDHTYAGKKFQDYLQLMANCKHFIIPNSTFAWWAVWLSKNENKTVIAPKYWINEPPSPVNDLVPSKWIRI